VWAAIAERHIDGVWWGRDLGGVGTTPVRRAFFWKIFGPAPPMLCCTIQNAKQPSAISNVMVMM
jgi:hypothetical protein